MEKKNENKKSMKKLSKTAGSFKSQKVSWPHESAIINRKIKTQDFS